MKRKRASAGSAPKKKVAQQQFKPPNKIFLPTRSLANQEKKFLDTSIQNTADVSAGVIIPSLNLIPQGVTDVTRVGNKVTLTKVNLRGLAAMEDFGTAAFSGGVLRTILFIDKQTNGATAAVLDILRTAAVLSFRNMDNLDRFIILDDTTIRVPIESANVLHTAISRFPWSVNKKINVDVHFSGTTGAITELRSSNIGLLYIADLAVVDAAILGNARVKFVDA